MRLGAALALASVLVAAVANAAEEMTPEPIAVMQGLDKITARVSRFEAPVGKPVTFGTLSILVRDCQKSAPEERPENAAFIEIGETKPGEGKVQLFSGWMFSSSPALSALDHPVYDVNLLECKAARAAPPPIPPPAAPPGKSRGKSAR
ncbi:MAG TPA: DUF2155 domain-containing protein [Stellaceae bacterium]